MKREIAFFDFDGTITNKDSLLEFTRFVKGNLRFTLGMLLMLPLFLGLKLGLVKRQRTKELFLTYFFYGMPFVEFEAYCIRFSLEKIPSIIRQSALERLAWHKQKSHCLVIVSASPEAWLKPWCNQFGYSCIGSNLEIINGKITGKLIGKNCHGIEKTKRIKELYNLETYNEVYAYGDSSGDKPMLKLASKAYYKPFRDSSK